MLGENASEFISKNTEMLIEKIGELKVKTNPHDVFDRWKFQAVLRFIKELEKYIEQDEVIDRQIKKIIKKGCPIQPAMTDTESESFYQNIVDQWNMGDEYLKELDTSMAMCKYENAYDLYDILIAWIQKDNKRGKEARHLDTAVKELIPETIYMWCVHS